MPRREELTGEGLACRIEAAPQHGPGDPGQLVGQRHHGDVRVHALQEPAAAERTATVYGTWAADGR